jgi:hypothetical protein
VKERVYGNIGIASLFDVSSQDIIHDVIDVGNHPDVVTRYPFWKAGGAASIENIGEILPWIDLNPGRGGWGLQ